MATTTSTLSISDNNINYSTTAVAGSPNDYFTELATISGTNDSVTINSNNNDTVVNDVILVTGLNDQVSDNGYAGVIDAHTTTSTLGLSITGADDTVYGGGGLDTIYSHGEIITFSGNSSQTVAGASHTVGGANVFEVGNFLYGEGGNDTINFSSADTVYGGAGDDHLNLAYTIAPVASIGADNSVLGAFISGDAGNDTISISASAGYNTVYGGDGDDTLYGNSTNGFDSLYGQAGNDLISISGVDSNDVIYGGAGNDKIVVTSTGGYHFISGDLGNDTVDLSGSTGINDTVYGGAGDDTILGSGGTGNQLYGQTGNDTITLVGQGSVYGGQGNDLITDGTAHAANSFFSGDLGDDSIFAYGANDTLYGGDGNDSLLAHGANDQLFGQAGNDILLFDVGTSVSTNATIYGGAGDDYISVGFTETVHSGTAIENPTANPVYDQFNDTSYGSNAGVSYSYAQATDGVGHHFLSGDLGNDTIYGGSGGDTFVGGAGSDQLYSNRLTASGNDPSAPNYQANGAGDSSVAFTTDTVDPNSDTVGSASHSPQVSPTVTPSATTLADVFVFHANDSVGTSPVAPGTGSDISTGGGEAGIDHIHGFLLNVTGQEAIFTNSSGVASQSFINSQVGDDLVFLTGTHTTYFTGSTAGTDATLDTNVFYGTATNVVTGTAAATEQSDYSVAYTYAFGTGGTAASPTSSAHFANSVDFIVVDVYDSGASSQNGNIFVFDHNGNAVALDGAGLPSQGTAGTFENSTSPTGGLNEGNDALGSPLSTTTVNIYH